MPFRSLTLAGCAAATLSACTASGLNTQSYPGRTQLQYMSADQITVLSYACVPGDSARQTQSRGARAHSYVDAALRNAEARFGVQNAGFAALGAQAEMNAEIARISQVVETEYRCAFIGKRNANGIFG